MDNVLQTIHRISPLRSRSAERAQEAHRAQLLAEIRAVNRQLQCAQTRFNHICDSDLVDACIYEIDALHAQYRYLLQQARASGITEQPFALPADSAP